MSDTSDYFLCFVEKSFLDFEKDTEVLIRIHPEHKDYVQFPNGRAVPIEYFKEPIHQKNKHALKTKMNKEFG